MKVFDIKKGHYVDVINEDENQGNDKENPTKDTTKIDSEEPKTFKSAAQDEKILEIDKKLEELKLRKEQTVKNATLQLQNAKAALTSKESVSVYDPADVDPNILALQATIEDAENEYNVKAHALKVAKLGRLKELQNVTESFVIDLKKNNISESVLTKAKIYLSKLFKMSCYDAQISKLSEFKKLFKESDLLYGKDSNGGFFVVCIDKDDFEKMRDILLSEGYEDEDIMNVVMPQLFNRKMML